LLLTTALHELYECRKVHNLSGYLRFRVVGMDATEYVISCLFLGDPDTAPDPNQPAALPRKLLQPFGLLDRLRFMMDRDPNDGTPYGTLTVEKK
jgi:hypothetical protein